MSHHLKLFKDKISTFVSKKKPSQIGFIDLDETLIRQKNVGVYIKELIRDEKELKNVLNDDSKTIQTFKLVINNILTNIDKYKEFIENNSNTELLLINVIDYHNLLNLNIQKNEFIKLTKYYEPNDNNINAIISMLTNINQNCYQISILDSNKQKQYYTLNQFKTLELNETDTIKIDFKSSNIDFIKSFYTGSERLQHITHSKGKDILNQNLEQYSQVMMKTKVSKSKLNDDLFSFCDTIEVQKRFTPTTFNAAFINKGNNLLTPDFSEFSDSKKFIKNTVIFENTKESIINYYKSNALLMALTARDEFDEKEIILDYFKKNDMPFDYMENFGIEIVFSSSIPYSIQHINIDDKFKSNVVVMKKIIYINESLKCHNFDEVIMYEDNKIMLEALQNYLSLNHPNIKQTLILVEDETLLNFETLSNKINCDTVCDRKLTK